MLCLSLNSKPNPTCTSNPGIASKCPKMTKKIICAPQIMFNSGGNLRVIFIFYLKFEIKGSWACVQNFRKKCWFMDFSLNWQDSGQGIQKRPGSDRVKKIFNWKVVVTAERILTFNVHNSHGIKLVTRLRVGLRNLGKHKFRHNTQI